MKMKIITTVILISSVIMLSCGSKKETAASIAQKWCDLNAKAYQATEGPAKEAAETARQNFEKEMEAKYKDNESFMEEVQKEVEKCEDASEGRK